jgi:hypothetical protein
LADGDISPKNDWTRLHQNWPPRNPDLTTCDFFLWGFLKDLVYVRRPFANTD